MDKYKAHLETFYQSDNPDKKKDILRKIGQDISADALIFFFHIMEDGDVSFKNAAHKYMQAIRVKLIEQGEDVDSLLKIEFVKKYLEKYRSSTDRNEKLSALKRLSKIKTPVIFKQLTAIINSEKDYFILGVILKLIAYNGESRAIPILKVFLNQPNVALRLAAIEAFSYIHSTDLSEFLSQLIIDPESRIALKVCELLWHQQPILIRNKIQEVIRSGSKSDKQLLIEVLKKVSTFDAKNFLLVLCEDPDVGQQAKQYSDNMAIKYEMNKAEIEFKELFTDDSRDIYKEVEEETNLEIQLKKLSTLYHQKNEKTLQFCCRLLEKTTSKFIVSSLVKNIPGLAKSLQKASEVKKQLLPYLNHQDERVRANTIEGLTEIPDVDVIQSILKIIENDMSHRVISTAANFLFEIAYDKVLEKLEKMAKSGNFPQKNSVLFVIDNKISKINVNDFNKIIGILSHDQNFEIVKKAKALQYKSKTLSPQETEDSEAQDLVLDAKDSVAARINQILEFEEIPIDVIENQFRVLEDPLSSKNDRLKSIRALSSLIISDKQIKRFSDQLVNFSGDTVILSALIPAVGRVAGKHSASTLKEYLTHEDARIRANTIEILGEILEDEIEIDTIVSPMLSDKDYRVNANAIKILYSTSKSKAIQKINEMLGSTNKKSRNSGIFAIREIKDPGLIEILKRHVNDPDMEVAIHAGYAMIELEKSITQSKIALDDLPVEEMLLKLLDVFQYGDVYSRKVSIEKIMTLMVRENIGIVGKILESTDHEYIQSLLVKMLGFTESEEIIPIVTPFLKNENERVRANAVEGLSMVNSQDVPFILGTLILKETDSRTLSNIIIGISNFSVSDAKDYLQILERQKKLDEEHIVFLNRVLSEVKTPALSSPQVVESPPVPETSELIEKQPSSPAPPETKVGDSDETSLPIRTSIVDEPESEPEVPDTAGLMTAKEPEVRESAKTPVSLKKAPVKSTVAERKKPSDSFKQKYSKLRKEPAAEVSPEIPEKKAIASPPENAGRKKIQVAVAVSILLMILASVFLFLPSGSAVSEIEKLVSQGDFSKAARLLGEQKDKDTNPDLIYLAVLICLEKTEYQEAEKLIDKGSLLASDSVRFARLRDIVLEAKKAESGKIKIDIAKLNEPQPVKKDPAADISFQNSYDKIIEHYCRKQNLPDTKQIMNASLNTETKILLDKLVSQLREDSVDVQTIKQIERSKTDHPEVRQAVGEYFFRRNDFEQALKGFLYAYRSSMKSKAGRNDFLTSELSRKISDCLCGLNFFCDSLFLNLAIFSEKPDAQTSFRIAAILGFEKDQKSFSASNYKDLPEFKDFGDRNKIRDWISKAEKLPLSYIDAKSFFDFLDRMGKQKHIPDYFEHFDDRLAGMEYFQYKAEYYIRNGGYNEASSTADKGLEKFPASSRLLYLKGLAHFKSNKLETALSFLEKSISADPSFEDPIELVLEIYVRKKDTPKLLKYCSMLVDSGCRSVFPYLKLAELDAAGKNYENAFMNYYKALSFAKNEGERKKINALLIELKKKIEPPGTKVTSSVPTDSDININTIKDLKIDSEDLINLYSED